MKSPSQTQSTNTHPTTSEQPPEDVAAEQSPDIAPDVAPDIVTDHSPDQSPDIAADESTNAATHGCTAQPSDQSPDIAADESINVATHGWTDRSNVEPPVSRPITMPTLSNSILLRALSGSNVESPVSPITMTNTSPESEAVQRRRRLRVIVASAIAVLDGHEFDPIDPMESFPTTHQQLPQ
jgi:hypothetical protein